MKKIKFVFVNVLVILFFFVFFELIVRYFYPEIILSGTSASLLKENVYLTSPGITPNTAGESYGIIKESNSYGFWKYGKIDSSKKKTKYLFLGDSVTMGIGVDNDSTFAGIINSSPDSVEVLNPSLIGYSSKDYLNIIKKLLVSDQNKLGINKIFIFWCLNDVYDNYPVKGSPDIRSAGLIGRLVAFISRNFKTWHFVKELFSDRPKDYFQYDCQFYKEDDPNLKQSFQDIVECYSVAKKKGIEIELIILPYEFQIRYINTDKYNQPQLIIKNYFNNYDVTVIDVLELLGDKTKDSKSFFLFGDGIHFSKNGHKLIANILINHRLFLTHKSENPY